MPRLAAGALILAALAGAYAAGTFGAVPALPPCQTEHSSNCVWDDVTRGYSLGVSFVNLGGVNYYAEQLSPE